MIVKKHKIECGMLHFKGNNNNNNNFKKIKKIKLRKKERKQKDKPPTINVLYWLKRNQLNITISKNTYLDIFKHYAWG